MEYDYIIDAVLNTSFDIHKRYGPGLLEKVYEEILCYELRKQGFLVSRQRWLHLQHDELRVRRTCRADLIVNNLVLVEVKSVRGLDPEFYKTVLTYLTLAHIEIGLLINFNVPLLKNGIRRVINSKPSPDPMVHLTPKS